MRPFSQMTIFIVGIILANIIKIKPSEHDNKHKTSSLTQNLFLLVRPFHPEAMWSMVWSWEHLWQLAANTTERFQLEGEKWRSKGQREGVWSFVTNRHYFLNNTKNRVILFGCYLPMLKLKWRDCQTMPPGPLMTHSTLPPCFEEPDLCLGWVT